MVAGADSDTVPVENLSNVMRVRPFEAKRQHGTLVRRLTMDGQAIYAPESLISARVQRIFMRLHICMIERRHPVQRCSQADSLEDWRCTCLEFVRRRIVGHPVAGHDFDHLAAPLIGPRTIQRFCCPIERADARRAIEFVPGHDIPVTPERLNIDLQMDRSLAAIGQHFSANFMREAANLGHVRHAAEHIAHMGNRDHTRFRTNCFRQVCHVQRTIFVQAHPFQDSAMALPQEMPRNDVGMMLHDGEDNLVARLNPGGERRGDKVDAFRRPLGVYDIFCRRRVEECSDFLTRGLIGLGGLVRQGVNATMHIGICRARLVCDLVDHRIRFLRTGSIVQIHQRLAIHFT